MRLAKSSSESAKHHRARVIVGFLGATTTIASLVLLLSDDPRWLRVGIVLALWAAAFTAIALAWARHDCRTTRSELEMVTYRLQSEEHERSVSVITA